MLDGLERPATAWPSPAPPRPLCVLAGAGSGKTRVLTRRIAYRALTGDHDPRHVLALTFTRKAAGELSTRLRSLGLRDSVAAGTFHAVAYAQLRTRWADRGIRPPELLDRKVGFVARLLSPSERSSVLDIVTEIEWAKARAIAPDEYGAEAHRLDPPRPPRLPRDGRGLRALRDREAGPAHGRLRRPAPAVPARPARGPRVRPVAALALPARVRRRVPGRQPPAARPARGVAGRPRRPVRGGRPQPGHLRVERRRPDRPHRLRRRATPGPR